MLNLEEIKEKAKYYGYYADNLFIWELIEEVEKLRAEVKALKEDIVVFKQGHY